MNYILLLIFYCFTQFAFGQGDLQQDYFINPVKIPISLSGNFGELRDDHFHSGLDIRTQQRTGLKVYAAASGYISRIKIQTFGYGKAIYIQHPNGYTTVYAHLKEFAPEIRAFVRQKMYAEEVNTIALRPDSMALPVKQGQLIAYSGESGSAGGPHLHFEIRDSLQYPMNPLLFGFNVADHTPPKIRELYVYPIGKNAQVNRSAQRQRLNLRKQTDGTYITDEVKAYGKIGFGIVAVDYSDNSPYSAGIYKIKTDLNGELRLDVRFNRFSFAHTRYINRYIDYAFKENHDREIQKLFMQPNEKLDMQVKTINKGYVNVDNGLNYKYKIVLEDFPGNKTVVYVPIQASKLPKSAINRQEKKKTPYFALANKPNVFNLKNHDVFIPEGALYENIYLKIEDHPGKITVGRPTTPLHKYITIGFDVRQYTKEDREKLYVARLYPWGTSYYSKTHKDGNRITTRTRTFGTFGLLRDDTPPTISPVNFHQKDWVSTLKSLKLKITDEGSGISTYRGTINGHFIVMEYDYQTDIITYYFKDDVSDSTKNKLKIIVVDNVGNSSTFETVFFRKDQMHKP